MQDLRVVPHLLKHVLHVGKSKRALARPLVVSKGAQRSRPS
jgi:hypothetical protein